MPVIRIEFDNQKVSEKDISLLAEATREIVLNSSEIDVQDVVVYANNSQIKVSVHPIEIFIQISAHKVKDINALVNEIKSKLSEWKKMNNFSSPITLSISPENWIIETGI
ncbi:MAG: hypothetical protein G01um101477_294 [Candidatus Doudnabacteria bacterium Gr01-1014_77]|uniref:Uncharacterized protein n=1 Tax=Candidatus Doudnabacteria bacterium Gr01-1014_77 TaxID=2017133 RepID=A0A554JC89_9BACT|nr:MAG: hypothetical protein G01um101477_294 [Candidatus Doudnabacteria bacterium Gr01-1014_77]